VHDRPELAADLDREGADAARGAIDEDTVASREARLVAIRLEDGETNERGRGGVGVADDVGMTASSFALQATCSASVPRV